MPLKYSLVSRQMLVTLHWTRPAVNKPVVGTDPGQRSNGKVNVGAP